MKKKIGVFIVNSEMIIKLNTEKMEKESCQIYA